MSDIVLGALIGIGATALGSIIIGILNYKNTKAQLRHQEREAQRNRLIAARKDTLVPLRNKISEWVACSSRQAAMIVRLDKAIKNKDSVERQLEMTEYYASSKRMELISLELDIARGQISDNKLDNLIDNVREKQLEIDTARMPLLIFFNNPEAADANTIESAMSKDESLLKELRNQLFQVNKRIEELLRGEVSN